MEIDVAIAVQNVSKCYRRYNHPLDRFKELLFPGKSWGLGFWALHDINLNIKRGESVGILGQNGSGKSTLLQLITKTLTPTEGTIEVNGRISALLELGSGFNPDFTGRQNVMVNGRILGFSKKEIESKIEEILDFAEIGDFVDQPVHTYSSGMFVRLAFATAVIWEPEILIVDEALAVGDIFFQQKCFNRIKALQQQGVTLLFVSHDTQTILNLCKQAAVLDRGRLIYLGEASAAVEAYYEQYYMSHRQGNTLEMPHEFTSGSVQSETLSPAQNLTDKHLPLINSFSSKNRFGSMKSLIEGVCITDKHYQAKAAFEIDEELLLSVKIGVHPLAITPLNIGFLVKDRLGQVIIGANTKMLAQDLNFESPGEPFICQFRFHPQVAPGEYGIDIAVAENEMSTQNVYDWISNSLSVVIVSSTRLGEQSGICRPKIQVKPYTHLT